MRSDSRNKQKENEQESADRLDVRCQRNKGVQ